jgi:hypothetical protein
MPQPTHNYSWILLLPYNKMWAYSRVWEWPHLQLDDLQIVPANWMVNILQPNVRDTLQLGGGDDPLDRVKQFSANL